MSTSQRERLKLLFDRALARPPEARAAFVAEACGADAALREELVSLLRANESSAGYVEELAERMVAPALATVARGPSGDLAAGATVSHYEILARHGGGGMGVVYRARDLRLDRLVALKFLPLDLTADEPARARLVAEAKAASALDHPNIAVIYEIAEAEASRPFIAMAWYEGETLRQKLARGPLALPEALAIATQLAEALAAAHRAGIIHRDVKPANVLVTQGGVAKLLDFGIAKLRSAELTGEGTTLGTAAYMSPEQARGQAVDPRSDLWSLGVLLFEMLTGELPFGGGHDLSTIYRILHEAPPVPSSLRPELPPLLEQLVLQLLRKEPDARYASAAEVLEALSRLERPARPARPDPCAAPANPRPGARPHNLPAQPTSLIGREREIGEIEERLRGSELCLLTLTGPGGTGKTRLALQVAARLAAHFRDGACFVNLAPLSDPRLVPSAIAQTLGVQEAAERPLAETLLQALRERHLLLLLDNFEHLVEGAPLVGQILASAPQVKLLVTSRTPLHLRGEHEYPVPPLSLPDPAGPPPLEPLTRYEAVQLFLERAQRVHPDFALTSENAAAILEICHRLDGLPLAIELAAARIRILPPQALHARLHNRLGLLTGGARDLPERHRTLRATLAWSHDLLSEGEKVLFRRLSVFAGGRTLEAIEEVCAAEGDASTGSGQALELEVLEGVSSLVDKNLLRQEEDAAGEPRFVMLETIHEYATEKLQESGEAEQLRRRHAAYFLALAQAAEPQLDGREQGRWLARLKTEHDNLRAALRGLLERGESESAARLAGMLWRLWLHYTHYSEGTRWLEEVLGAAGLTPATRAKALLGAGALASRQNDTATARPLLEESLALARALDDRMMIARALNGLGNVARNDGEPEHAEDLYGEALSLMREAGDRQGMGVVLSNLGGLAQARRDYPHAEFLYEERLALAREAGNTRLAGLTLHNLGHLAYDQRDLGRAAALLRESLRCVRDAGDVRLVMLDIAYLALAIGAAGEEECAARLFGAAEARFAAMGTHVLPNSREDYDRGQSAIRARVPREVWERAWAEGQAMTLAQAVACALEEDEQGEPDPHA